MEMDFGIPLIQDIHGSSATSVFLAQCLMLVIALVAIHVHYF